MTADDVVRHRLVKQIIIAYDKDSEERNLITNPRPKREGRQVDEKSKEEKSSADVKPEAD